MPSDSPSTPSSNGSVDSHLSPTRGPLSNIDEQASAAVESVVQNLMKGSLGGSSSSGKRKPADDKENEDSESDLQSYIAHGRTFGRNGDIFNSVNDVVQHGVKLAIVDSDDEQGEETEHHKRLRQTWELLCSLIPKFRIQMVSLSNQIRIRKQACRKIMEGMNCVRAEDAASLKGRILSYLLLDKKSSLEPAIKLVGKKTDRGWAHPVTARLLCPLKYPATEETYSDILAGKKLVTGTVLLRFLYPDNQEYNEEDMDDGVLRGHLMLRVAKHIFQGPSAALERPGYHRGKRGNASLMGMTSMTPRAIAYVAVQTRFALSSSDQWAVTDGTFSYATFFWAIVSLFDDGEGADIIKFYDNEVFGMPSNENGENPEALQEDTDFDRVKAQRAAKRARLAIASEEVS